MKQDATPDPQPRARHAPLWPIVLSGGAGCAAITFLAAINRMWPQDAAIAVLIVAAVTGFAIMRGAAASETGASAAQLAAGEMPASEAHAALIDALPQPILLIAGDEPDDVTGRRYLFANAAARSTLRLPAPEGLLVTAIRDPQVLETVDEALFGELGGETLYETGGAQNRVLRAFARPLGVGSGGARLALLMLLDETEARQVEQTRVDFLANASHELRTPLASLAGFIETLRGHARDDPAARDKFLGIMGAQAERMRRLVDDLMSLSRIELNEHVPPGDCVDLSRAVADVLDALGPIARQRGVTLEARLPGPGAARVTGDRDQIVQVAQNLIDNAIKYSPDAGKVVVEVLTDQGADQAAAQTFRTGAARLSLLTPDHPAGAYALLRVGDEGVGIARENLPRLTERFYRVEGQKSGELSGTGLGLAIVKHIANRHRGGMTVESAPGEGSAFAVYFPQAEAAEGS